MRIPNGRWGAWALATLALAAPDGAGGARPAAESFPGVVQPDPGSGIAASRNGKAIAFAASFREAGGRHDPAADPTVFLWDRRTGDLRQVTASGPSDQPSVENATFRLRIGASEEKEPRTRTVVAFRSSADLSGRNADGSEEIFAWDSLNGSFAQLSDAVAGASSRPAVGARFEAVRNAAGQNTGAIRLRYRVAFLSTADLAGDNGAGLPQVFLYDSGAAEVDRLVQVSHSATGAAGPPTVDREGIRVAFVHDGDLLPGDGPPGTPAVYAFDALSGVLRRLSAGEDDGVGAADPVLDSRGRFVAWSATGSGGGPRKVFVADLRRGRVREIVPSAGDHRAPALGKGGRRLLLLSTDPGPGGGAPVPERPVLFRRRRGIAEVGVEGPGGFGRPVLARDRRRAFLTSTADLDGRNAEGREVLYLLRARPR